MNEKGGIEPSTSAVGGAFVPGLTTPGSQAKRYVIDTDDEKCSDKIVKAILLARVIPTMMAMMTKEVVHGDKRKVMLMHVTTLVILMHVTTRVMMMHVTTLVMMMHVTTVVMTMRVTTHLEPRLVAGKKLGYTKESLVRALRARARAHIHTRAYMFARTHARALAYTRAYMHACSHTAHVHSRNDVRTHAKHDRAHKHASSLAHAYKQTVPRCHTRARALGHARAHTQTSTAIYASSSMSVRERAWSGHLQARP
eukprot:4886981-Pleurochrysis_carterae.AAC.1